MVKPKEISLIDSLDIIEKSCISMIESSRISAERVVYFNLMDDVQDNLRFNESLDLLFSCMSDIEHVIKEKINKETMKINEFVYSENFCQFEYYRKGVMYYTVKRKETDDLYIFPIPAEDLGDATLNKSEKSIFLMRYMRKALDEGTLVKYSA